MGLTGSWRVRITRGPRRLHEGVVFWLGDGHSGPRCGIRTDENETVWADATDVRPVDAEPEPPVVKRRTPGGETSDATAKPASGDGVRKRKPPIAGKQPRRNADQSPVDPPDDSPPAAPLAKKPKRKGK